MKKITLLLSLMITALVSAQQVVVQNFETSTSYTFAGFEGLGSATIEMDPAVGGTRLNNLKLVSQSSGNPWQGAEIIQQVNKLKLTTDKTVKVDVYATQAFTMLAKVESGTGPNSACSQSYTTPNTWQTLTFTFNQSLDGTDIANGNYQKLVFFPNWKATNDGFNPPANFSIYVDNITSEAAPVTPPPADPTVAAPTPPARPAADVISLFSDAYSNIAITEWSTSWDDSSIVDLSVAGNPTKKITFGNFLGVQLGAYQNATDFTHFHMDYYINAGTDLIGKVVNPKLSNHAAMAGETNALLLTHLPTTAGSWASIDVELSTFTPQGAGIAFAREKLYQFIIASNVGTLYVDNIYLHKNTILGNSSFEVSKVKMYPNPARNILNIESVSTIEKISVLNLLGQEVLTVTPNNELATIDVSSLQVGVYVVRTSIDGNVASSKFIKE